MATRSQHESAADVDVIFVGGAPGVGKTTLSAELKRALGSPLLEFSLLRQPHLDATWSNASPEEEEMAFANLLYIVENYRRHGYRNVVVTDLKDERLCQVPERFTDFSFRIVSLVMRDEDELRRRLSQRRGGFTDVSAAIAWNRALIEREPVNNEVKVEVDGCSVAELAQAVVSHG